MVVVILLIIGLVIFTGIQIIDINVYGSPPKDEDVLEFINKVRNSNPSLLSGASTDCMITSSGNPFISSSINGVLFGFYINNVGLIPKWYKSHSEIKRLYNELGANKTKREKLGL
jgi:hypothetical protein